MSGDSGIPIMAIYGKIIKLSSLLFLLFISTAVCAFSVEVHLRRWKHEDTVSDLLLITDSTNSYELPTPPFELGESCTNLNDKIAVLGRSDTVIAASISEVVPIAITGLQDLYIDGFSSPLFWYRVKCDVKNVVKGVFPFSSVEFVATYSADRIAWQFVKGYAFHFGLKETEEGWTVERYFRSCPIAPFRIEDHINYYKMRRENPDYDWSQPDAVIKEAEDRVGRWCRDASLEKGQYFILTFDGDKLWGNLNIDYGKSVTILTNEWVYTLPENIPGRGAP